MKVIVTRCQISDFFDCEKDKENYIPNQWRNHSSDLFWIEEAVQKSKSQTSVIQFASYFRWNWFGMKYKYTKESKWGWFGSATTIHVPLIADDFGGKEGIHRVAMNHLQFKTKVYDFANTILKEVGVKGDNYSVIQWRGEIHSLDYVSCAKHIITARDIMREKAAAGTATSIINKDKSNGRGDDNGFVKSNGDGHEKNPNPFILISSLNHNESLQVTWEDQTLNRNKTTSWKTGSKGNDAQEALKLLLDENGFLKLDSLASRHLDFIRDPIYLAATDLILAQNSKEFVTCDKPHYLVR